MRLTKLMKRLHYLLFAVCAALFLVCAPVWASAQQEKGAEPSAAKLYDEAVTYTQKKFSEFESQQVPFDEKLAEKTKQEQRELAARHAAGLSARPDFSGDDLYYLGQLYSLAERSSEAIAAMRRYLERDPVPAGELAQNARAVIFFHALGADELTQAASSLADYARHEPQSLNNRFRMESTLIGAYRKKNQPARAAELALLAIESVQAIGVRDALEAHLRNQMVYVTGSTLADIYLETNKRAEATRTLQRMRRLGLSIPSAAIYRQATRRLAVLGEKVEDVKAEPGASATLAPDLDVAEWIDQKPIKLSELRGKVVLLDFWATWCGPCHVTFPVLRDLHEKYKDKGLIVLGATRYYGTSSRMPEMSPKEELAYLRRFKRTQRLPYGFAVAADEANDLSYGVTSIPTAFLIDHRGAVRHISVGVSAAENANIVRLVEKLLDEAGT